METEKIAIQTRPCIGMLDMPRFFGNGGDIGKTVYFFGAWLIYKNEMNWVSCLCLIANVFYYKNQNNFYFAARQLKCYVPFSIDLRSFYMSKNNNIICHEHCTNIDTYM